MLYVIYVFDVDKVDDVSFKDWNVDDVILILI